jgi:hypothetical protein
MSKVDMYRKAWVPRGGRKKKSSEGRKQAIVVVQHIRRKYEREPDQSKLPDRFFEMMITTYRTRVYSYKRM